MSFLSLSIKLLVTTLASCKDLPHTSSQTIIRVKTISYTLSSMMTHAYSNEMDNIGHCIYYRKHEGKIQKLPVKPN